MVKEVKVAVAIPGEFWRRKTGSSMVRMIAYYLTHHIKGYDVQSFELFTTEGSMLVQLRHELTKKALQRKCSHIMFIDSDMIWPADTLNKLLAHKKGFVALNCTTRRMPPEPVAHDLNGNRLCSTGRHGLQKVQQVGLAVALIETRLLAQLQPPLYLQDWVPDYKAYCGEDVYFCQLLQHVTGESLYIDHDLSRDVKHVGNYEYGHGDVLVEPTELKQVNASME